MKLIILSLALLFCLTANANPIHHDEDEHVPEQLHNSEVTVKGDHKDLAHLVLHILEEGPQNHHAIEYGSKLLATFGIKAPKDSKFHGGKPFSKKDIKVLDQLPIPDKYKKPLCDILHHPKGKHSLETLVEIMLETIIDYELLPHQVVEEMFKQTLKHTVTEFAAAHGVHVDIEIIGLEPIHDTTVTIKSKVDEHHLGQIAVHLFELNKHLDEHDIHGISRLLTTFGIEHHSKTFDPEAKPFSHKEIAHVTLKDLNMPPKYGKQLLHILHNLKDKRALYGLVEIMLEGALDYGLVDHEHLEKFLHKKGIKLHVEFNEESHEEEHH